MAKMRYTHCRQKFRMEFVLFIHSDEDKKCTGFYMKKHRLK